MKSKIIAQFFSLFLIVNCSFGQNSSLDTLDNYIPKLIQYFGAPGLAISIVQDGEIKYTKGFGTKTINKNDKVDNNTLFAIGSISKSFTAIALAMLVDEGKIDWDDRVVKYIPYFQLYDPYVTSSFTVRDLLTHRSGLKEVSGGTLWYHSDLSREDIIRGLKYLDPVTEFRTKPAYQNTMFLVASKVLESVAGEPWDEFVRRRIFEPLGMNNTVISQAERRVNQNISTPHIRNEKFEIITIDQEKLDNMAPAGSIYSCANDMAHYMNFLLNNGIKGNDTLISRIVFNEILKPQIHFQIFNEPIQNEFTSYGFGWWLTPKNGNKIVEHSGGVDGMVANLIMVKNRNFGVIALANSSAAGWAPFSLTLDIIGSFLGDVDYKNVSNYLKSNFLKNDSIQVEKRKKIQNSRIINTKPSLTMEKYAGTFIDEMYGDIFINYENKNLRIEFSHTPLFTGILSHWHYDTFEIDWEDPRVPNGFITFEFNSDGTISGFKLNQPDLLDVDFTELEIKKRDITKNKEY